MRRTVDELMALYALEPAIFDVYVEGNSDRAILDWFLRKSTARNFAVHEIDRVHVEVPDGEGGNRQRIVELEKELSARASGTELPVVCVADRDFDGLVGAPLSGTHLVLTEHASLDGLLMSPQVLNRFQALYLHKLVADPHRLIDAMVPVLREIYLTRATDAQMGLRLGALLPKNELTIESSGYSISFDSEEYATRYLNRGAAERRDEFLSKKEELSAQADNLGTPCCHGMDYVWLLRQVLKPYVNRSDLLREETMKRALRTCLEIDDLVELEPFRTVLARCGS